jgi:uncharacterized protein HemX
LDEVPNLRGGHGKTVALILGPILAAVGMFGGMVWQAARYPDRSEFNTARDRAEAIAQNVAVMSARLEAVQQATAEVKAQIQRIETKLDDKRRK